MVDRLMVNGFRSAHILQQCNQLLQFLHIQLVRLGRAYFADRNFAIIYVVRCWRVGIDRSIVIAARTAARLVGIAGAGELITDQHLQVLIQCYLSLLRVKMIV